MTHDEAADTYCPLDTNPESTGACVANKCNWWLETGPAAGECAIRRVARMLTEPTVMLAKDLHLPNFKMVGGLVETEDD